MNRAAPLVLKFLKHLQIEACRPLFYFHGVLVLHNVSWGMLRVSKKLFYHVEPNLKKPRVSAHQSIHTKMLNVLELVWVPKTLNTGPQKHVLMHFTVVETPAFSVVWT